VGRFRGTRAIISNKTVNLFPGGKASVTIVANDLQFTASTQHREEIWCVPLFGNLKSFMRAHTACSLNDRRSYIAFQDQNRPCGVEILNLSEPRQSNEYSAVAFGEIGEKAHQAIADIQRLLPVGFVTALSFAAGSDIRAPWIDLRSLDGQLSRRIHLRMGANTRRDGYPALTEYDTNRPNSGLGEFLNRFFAVPAERIGNFSPP
jgi:hypothetical protein